MGPMLELVCLHVLLERLAVVVFRIDPFDGFGGWHVKMVMQLVVFLGAQLLLV